jgi:glycosyltransferase involved in cell wall biosynthesis
MKICMFVKNSFEYDARVTKEAKSLIAAGHDVTVVALYVPNVTAIEETTTDGIHVVRVPRSSFGVPALNSLATRYAGTIEARHVRLTGDTYNEATVRELGQLSAPSTAAPGSAAKADSIVAPSEEIPGVAAQAWGRATTPVLRSFARFTRFSFRGAKGLLGQQSQWLKHRAIDSRMIDIGVASGADVFHSHDLNTLRVGAECKARTGALLVYDSHELQTERNRMTEQGKKSAQAQEGEYLVAADAMIVASPSWIRWNTNLYGQLPDPAITVLNVPEPITIDTTKDLRAELGIEDSERIVIYQGSIQENRGIEPAIDAVEHLDKVTLVVIGYGHHRPVLEDLVVERGLTSKVRFFGPVPNAELISYSASADAGLANIVNSSVSYNTSLPNKLFEYAMAGIPVVGSDSPEIGRIVAEEKIGEVCNAEDPVALGEAITTILEDPTRYDRGLKHAASTYNWTVEQKKLLDLYEALGER